MLTTSARVNSHTANSFRSYELKNKFRVWQMQRLQMGRAGRGVEGEGGGATGGESGGDISWTQDIVIRRREKKTKTKNSRQSLKILNKAPK